MASLMGVGTYMVAWKAAGSWAAPPRPRPFLLTRGIPLNLPPELNAVYIACMESTAHYVGSTTRGAAIRVREHVRDRTRAAWEELWVVPLRDDVSKYGVSLAEERVGTIVKPVENLRRPGR